jgi:4-carboxymuconolactone decarboxylase
MARIPPITGKADVAPEYHYVVDQVMAVFGGLRGPFSMLLHSPKLAEKMLPLVTFNREESVVEGRLRSLAVLATVREREGAYVWAAQVGNARRSGLSEAAIDILRAKADPAALPAEERDIVLYARQLAQTNRVDQPVFATLLQRYGAQWLVELTAAASYFGMLCGLVNAFEVPAPPDGDRFAS